MRPHTPDDIDETLLTAYALGELDMDADERERVAARVESDADALRFVEDVRESAGLVVGALDMELVDGLSEFQHEMIERRLRELHGEPEPESLPFRPAVLRYDGSAARAASLARRARFRRWLPTLASAAAAVLIIAGTLGFFLQYQNKQVASGNNAGSNATTPNPVRSSTTMPPLATNTIAQSDESATDATDEQADSDTSVAVVEDEGPVEGMVKPKSVATANKPAKKKAPAKAPAAAVAKKPAAPAPVAVAAAAAQPRTYRSPEAKEARRPSVASAMAAAKPAGRSPKSVSASPVRDAQALDKPTAGSAATPPKLFENPFRTVAEQPNSSFRVPPYDLSYKRIEKAIVEDNRLPNAPAARVEELLNHFTYSYPAPTDNLAIAVSVEVATCPWDVNRRLARIALKARDARPGDRDKTVASDLTSTVQFNASATSAWRLIGYESGMVAPDGTFPGADVSAGATATALYEIAPVPGAVPSTASPSNLFTVSVRYRDTAGGQRETIKAVAADTGTGFDRAGDDFRFASSVAAFGMLFRESRFAGTATYPEVIRWATAGKGADESGQRAAFIDLARRARDLRAR